MRQIRLKATSYKPWKDVEGLWIHVTKWKKPAWRGRTLCDFNAVTFGKGRTISGGSDSKESACNMGDLGSIPESGRSREGNGNHSSILAWRIPWTEEPAGLQSIGSQRVKHDWSDLAHMCGHNKKINDFQGLMGKGWIGTSQGCLGQWNYSVWYHNGGHT